MSVARAYARALYEAARDAKMPAAEIERMDFQLAEIARAILGSKDFRAALAAPGIPAKDKAALVEQVAQRSGAAPLVGNFLSLLARRERLGVISEIRDAFSEVRLEAEGGVVGEVVS